MEKRQHALLNPREETILSPRGGKEDVRRTPAAPSAASVSSTEASHRSRRARGSVPAAAAVGASEADDARARTTSRPSAAGVSRNTTRLAAGAREIPTTGEIAIAIGRRAGAVARLIRLVEVARGTRNRTTARARVAVSGSSMISAGGISVGGVSVGARGIAGKAGGGYGVVGKQARVSHLGAKRGGTWAHRRGGRVQSPVSKHRSSEARHHGEARRSEYVSPHGQRRG